MAFGVQIVAGQETATNADILNSTRLQTFPAAGQLTIEISSNNWASANNHAVSLLLPDGQVPMESVAAPVDSAGVLDDRTALIATFDVGQGGHATFSTTLTGTATLTWRVTYTPYQ